jgi:hypothetical protein
MLFSFAVRSICQSSNMFVRGGVYVVVRIRWGRLSPGFRFGSAVRLHPDRTDQRQRGPVPGPSAERDQRASSIERRVPPDLFAVGFAIFVTLYFWWHNTKRPDRIER